MLGLDTNLTAEAKATGLFAPHGIEVPPLDLPVALHFTGAGHTLDSAAAG